MEDKATQKPKDGWIIVSETREIGGKPCWIERSLERLNDCLVWGGRRGAEYPDSSISLANGEDGDLGPVPCYRVQTYERENVMPVGFVVIDETEGTRYTWVHNLQMASGEPAYSAEKGDPSEKRRLFVIGTQEVAEGRRAEGPYVVDGIPYFSRTLVVPEEIWRGRERLLAAHRVIGLSVVGGEIAYAVQIKPEWPVRVRILGEERNFLAVREWHVLDAIYLSNPFVVFEASDPEPGDYANFVRLCDGRMEDYNVCGMSGRNQARRDDGILTVHLAGDPTPRTFDLRAIGILPGNSP
jgi:hypothetical protein